MITFGLGSSVPTSTKSSLKNLLPTVFNNAEISSCTVRVVETGSMISLFPAAEPRTPMSFTGTASMGMVAVSFVWMLTTDREGQADPRFLYGGIPSPVQKPILAFVMTYFLGTQSSKVVLKTPNVSSRKLPEPPFYPDLRVVVVYESGGDEVALQLFDCGQSMRPV